MLAKVISGSIRGVDGYRVTVEVDIAGGLPALNIVGLPDQSVKESKNRVVAAVRNSGYDFPSRKITVNLAPAHIKKEGPIFDLPIAAGIIHACKKVKGNKIKDYCLIGELALDGAVRPVNGVLSITIEMRRLGIKGIIAPYANRNEAGIVKGIDVIPIKCIRELAGFLDGNVEIKPYLVDEKEVFNWDQEVLLDLADIKGQAFAKRAIEVACAGGHNVLMVGPPGAGKTMLAKRIPYLLPELSFEEALQTTKVHSAYGLMKSDSSLITQRPFRSPHHTSSDVSLIGGGTGPRPGEVSLAHNGVLFLDEFPEFSKKTLEVLRQPLEDAEICVSRARQSIKFPSNFMLIAAMNPCPCGYYGHSQKACVCRQVSIDKYKSKISGPLLDRIDMHVEMPAVRVDELTNKNLACESTSEVKRRIVSAREIQKTRFAEEKNVFTNSQMNGKMVRKYCRLDSSGERLLKSAAAGFKLSARAFDRILKVARTIADLQGNENIDAGFIAEAIQYRAFDMKWGQ